MRDREPELAVLIVGYKSRDDLGPCLESLYAHTRGVEFSVWFINNSTDGSEAMIAERFPAVRIVPHAGNLGFAAGNNRLAREAMAAGVAQTPVGPVSDRSTSSVPASDRSTPGVPASDTLSCDEAQSSDRSETGRTQAQPRYLLLLNPDTVLLDNAVGTLVNFARARPEGGVWGGVPDLPTGQPDPGARQWRQSLRHVALQTIGLARFCRAGPPRTPEFEGDVPACSGAFMLADADVWRRLGGFDERYVMYSEESDFCYRVEKAGRRVLMTGRARLRHNVGSGSPVAHRRVVAIARGRMTFVRIHHSPFAAWLVGALTWTQYVRRWLIAGVTRPRSEACATYRRMWARPGEWWGGWAGRTIDGSPSTPRPAAATVPEAAPLASPQTAPSTTAAAERAGVVR